MVFLFFAMIMYTENWSPKRWHINDTRRTIMADTEIALRIFPSSSLFDFSRERKEKRKVLVSDLRSSIHRSIDFSFVEFEIWPNRVSNRIDISILQAILENFLNLSRSSEENTIQFDVFWIDLNNNQVINLNTCRMFKRINPFVMILSESS